MLDEGCVGFGALGEGLQRSVELRDDAGVEVSWVHARHPTQPFPYVHSNIEGGSLQQDHLAEQVEPGTVVIHVRDSKERGGPQLTFPRSAWFGFVAGLGRGRS
ncbi:DUF397 domain-containing protein [Streptomyces sp. NPDC046924]|uniref:DUF397 domain-containing protein n=1 Tax=Streptomyces sp. NPDC046924 TaxID=3155136 RepID=UPI0033D8730F